MPESSLDNFPKVKGICSTSDESRTSPMGQFSQSMAPLQRNLMLSTFCTENNVQKCLTHINQEMLSLGLTPVWTQPGVSSDLNVVAVLNCMFDLVQLHRRGLQTLENMEMEQVKSSNHVDFLQLTNTQLKEQFELSKRENTDLLEKERQLHLKVKNLQKCLKNEKEEVNKLQNIIASRASQYNHEMKRKEREFNKLKERLNQLLVNKKETKQAIDVLHSIGRADGKRSLWKTEKTEAKHEDDMYKTLLIDYENRQKELVLENAELKKVLHQMKKDMVFILSSRKAVLKGDQCEDGFAPLGHSDSEDEEELLDSSKESVDLLCAHAREKLTHSIRLQWRKLKNHVERLDSQVSSVQMCESKSIDTASQDTHEEMDRLKLEVKQCRDFIQTQQQLLQQQLTSPCDGEMSSLLNNGYMLQEKDRLRAEWKTLEEQRTIFERERKNFTEAAIRLSHERKAFEEERAMWIKHQFLNLTPFEDSVKTQKSNSRCAFQMSEKDLNPALAPEKLIKSRSDTPSPIHGCMPLTLPSPSELHHTSCLTPQTSSAKLKRRSQHVEEMSVHSYGNVAAQQWSKSKDFISYTQEKNGSM